jgi:hypothetical protein
MQLTIVMMFTLARVQYYTNAIATLAVLEDHGCFIKSCAILAERLSYLFMVKVDFLVSAFDVR